MPAYPERIVCLTEETADVLHRLGEGSRIVGVSSYGTQPDDSPKKPRVSAFITANFQAIDELHPDLVLAFSDLQADLVAELLRRGYPVVGFNQRSVGEILQTIRMIGGLVGQADRAQHLAGNLAQMLAAVKLAATRLTRRPRVFFEEWPDPLISGIEWVEELIEVAGGTPVFPELRREHGAKGRIVSSASVVERMPDVIIASWCGKRVKKEEIVGRSGWSAIPAVRTSAVFEIRSRYILQPGPVALTEGVRQLHALLCRSTGIPLEPALEPEEAWDAGG